MLDSNDKTVEKAEWRWKTWAARGSVLCGVCSLIVYHAHTLDFVIGGALLLPAIYLLRTRAK